LARLLKIALRRFGFKCVEAVEADPLGTCPTCGGSGGDPGAQRVCPACHGSGNAAAARHPAEEAAILPVELAERRESQSTKFVEKAVLPVGLAERRDAEQGETSRRSRRCY